MIFEKLKVDDEGVELKHHTKKDGGALDSTVTTGTDPLPSFVDAFKAFGSYAVAAMPVLWPVKEHVNVTTINLSESKDGRRQLQVSVNYAIEKLNGKTVSMTTPLVAQPGENAKDGGFVLDAPIMKMIATLEAEAKRYCDGERAQVEMFEGKSENERNVDEAMASAEVKSTRTPRGKKAEQPDEAKAAETPSLAVHEGLLAIGKDVPVEAIEKWTIAHKAAAIAYANNCAKGISFSMPLCVQRDAVKLETASV